MIVTDALVRSTSAKSARAEPGYKRISVDGHDHGGQREAHCSEITICAHSRASQNIQAANQFGAFTSLGRFPRLSLFDRFTEFFGDAVVLLVGQGVTGSDDQCDRPVDELDGGERR